MHEGEVNKLSFPIQDAFFVSPDEKEIAEIDEIELTPMIQIQEKGEEITISGYLQLSGKYVAKPDPHPNPFLNRDPDEVTGYVDSVKFNPFQLEPIDFSLEQELVSFARKIPVHIEIPRNKIEDLQKIYASIDSFDYEFHSSRKLFISADLILNGIHYRNTLPREEQTQTSSFPISYEYIASRNKEPEEGDEVANEFSFQAESDEESQQAAIYDIERNMEDEEQEDTANNYSLPVTEIAEVSKKEEFLPKVAEESEKIVETRRKESEPAVKVHVMPDGWKKKAMEKSEEITEEAVEVKAEESAEAKARETVEVEVKESLEVKAEVKTEKKSEKIADDAGSEEYKNEAAEERTAEEAEETDGSVAETAEDADQEEATQEEAERAAELAEQVPDEPKEEIKVSITKKGTKLDPVTVDPSSLFRSKDSAEQVETAERLRAGMLEVEADVQKSRIAQEKPQDDRDESEEKPKAKENALYLTNFMGSEETFTRLKMCIAQKDETLEIIAERYSILASDLAQANGLHSNATLSQGQVLYIPVRKSG
ncbi:LysM peptidoglycan-binding domain-containing protein [Aneurinibacillus terranovensis]|uniref:LysM peptidoglycan-binding domain-containing protein n=1 Tax=Aneurinibacillus terranovensis TaxID=278991 RepID=UPI0004291D5E|nr:LysM peptidoglycan-binding domain-containing protein [Aneurinibacillus terranovensis]